MTLLNTGVLEEADAALVDVTNRTPSASILHFIAREEIGWDFPF